MMELPALATYGAGDASVAHYLCDQHEPTAVAATIVDDELRHFDVTFGRLRDHSERLAASLAELGVNPGDRVATLMPKSAELLAAVLAIWRAGAVHVPLFTAFARPAIAMRLLDSEAKLVVTVPEQRAKLEPGDGIPANAPWQVITTGAAQAGDLRFGDLIDAHSLGFRAAAVGGESPFIQLYTSGTTGDPKGVVIPVKALAAFEMYMRRGLYLAPDDVYWNIADPGWAYGLYYAIVGPLLTGHRTILLNAAFSPQLCWDVLARFQVTNFAAAPTVYRALRAASNLMPSDLVLRRCSSAGEPLNPDVNYWAIANLGAPILDHYGQTELGMVIANAHDPDVARPRKDGSMGYPLPGWRVAVLKDEADVLAGEDELGRLAVDVPASEAMFFASYFRDPARTKERFSDDGRWYLTGDAARRDDGGAFYFSSRDDDVIIMAGYRIGPFEVESALIGHPAIAEAAVVGVPDELRGEVVEAFVTLRPGHEASAGLEAELQQHVKEHYAAHAYPRRVHVVAELPKTPSGKIQRFRLRENIH